MSRCLYLERKEAAPSFRGCADNIMVASIYKCVRTITCARMAYTWPRLRAEYVCHVRPLYLTGGLTREAGQPLEPWAFGS